MCDAVVGKKVEDSQPHEVIVQLVNEGMIKIDDGIIKANFPTFTSRNDYIMRKQLQPMTNNVVKCMDEICSKAAIIFKKHTPKELQDRCEQLAYVCHQADAMGIIIEKLVEQEYLVVPDKQTNLCIYGVKRVSDEKTIY